MLAGLLRKIRQSSQGATALEFAFAGPIIMLLTFGFFEFSMVLFTQGILSYSAEQATRYAMVNFEQDNLDEDYLTTIQLGIKNKARESFILIDNEKIEDIDVSVVADPADNTKTVSVTITYNYSMIMPFLDRSNFTLRGASESFLVQ